MTTRPELVGSFGMVASTHWIASEVGMSVLEQGGNAFDAAAAAGLVIQVVEPHLNGPGGEVPIIGWDAGDKTPFVVCGQGPAPDAATPEAFADLGLDLVPGTGLLAACVPGAFGAWMRLLNEHGRMGLRNVMSYAIHYASRGFPVLPRMSATIREAAPRFVEHWPSSAAIWLSGQDAPAAGTIIRNVALAETYERIVSLAEQTSRHRSAQIEAARRAFYEGFVAEAIDTFCRDGRVLDNTGRVHSGLLNGSDLAGWRAVSEAPVSIDYADVTVLKAGPWSQGPVMLQQLALLRGFDVEAARPRSAEFVHTVTECAKLAFADREAYYGDPDFVDVPLGTLLSESYNAERRELVGEIADAGPLRPGRRDGRVPRLYESPRPDETIPTDGEDGSGIGEPVMRGSSIRSGDTCHLDVIDRWGNAVSATPSGGWLQSSPAVPGLGFALGTRGQMFWLTPGLPATLAPGKRPRTTLTPTLALRDGYPCLAFGTPGGDGQDQWALQMLLRHLHHGLGLQEAIEMPRFQTEHFPSSFYPRRRRPGVLVLEDRFPPDDRRELQERGHRTETVSGWSLGRVCAVARDGFGTLRGAADPRDSHCYAVGR